METQEQLDGEIRAFLVQYIESPRQLAVLVLLARTSIPWFASAVSDELKIPKAEAQRHLERLCGRGLLQAKLAEHLCFVFNPVDPRAEAPVRQLVSTFLSARDSRTVEQTVFYSSSAVQRFLSDRDADPMRDFASAFRLKRDQDG